MLLRHGQPPEHSLIDAAFRCHTYRKVQHQGGGKSGDVSQIAQTQSGRPGAENSVDMSCTRRNNCRDQSSLVGIGGHGAPGEAIVIAGWLRVLIGAPFCVGTVVVVPVPGWLVGGNWYRIRRQCIEVSRGPVLV